MLLTRAPDRLQARHTSVVDDIRIWVDAPAEILRYAVEKGSIAMQGTSLTVAAIDGEGFAVALKLGLRKRDLERAVAIHPTVAEELLAMS